MHDAYTVLPVQSPKKRQVKAFRIDTSVLQALKVASRDSGISENAFVEAILHRRLEAEPLRRAFGHIVLEDEILASFSKLIDVDKLEAIGFDRGKRTFLLAKELFTSSGSELTFSQFAFKILGDLANWFEVEGLHLRPDRVTLRHKYGIKWSVFLRGFLSGAFEVVSRDKLLLNLSDEFVGVQFPQSERRSW